MEQSLADLTRQLSLQTTQLARQEVELAKAELRGKRKVQRASPPVPERAVESDKEDVRFTKQRAQEAQR
jgi:hypothetical protein